MSIRFLIRWHASTALTWRCLPFSLVSASCCCWYFLLDGGQGERKMPFSPLIPTFSRYHLLPVQPTSVHRFDWPSLSPVCPSGPSPWPLGLSDPFPASAAPPPPCAAPPVGVSPLLSKRQVKSVKSVLRRPWIARVSDAQKHLCTRDEDVRSDTCLKCYNWRKPLTCHQSALKTEGWKCEIRCPPLPEPRSCPCWFF